MRRNVRTIAVFGLLYAALAAAALVPLFGVGGLRDSTFSIGMVLAIALIPITAIVMTMLSGLMPRRPVVEPPAPLGRPRPSTPRREHFDFAFAAWNGIESAEAVARLSRRLTSLGMAHRFERGEIAVDDDGVRWALCPVAGALRIAGWVEADDAETRGMIKAAVEEFLSEELGIRLEPLAA